MKTLEKTGPQLTSRIKGDWIGLYRLVPFFFSFLFHPSLELYLEMKQKLDLNIFFKKEFIVSYGFPSYRSKRYWGKEVKSFKLCVFLIYFYRHFLKSPNFDGWFKTRRKEMTQKLEALHLEALCEEVRKQHVCVMISSYWR